jgi:catechol 2,3-dioxygenase
VALQVADLERSIRFYTHALGFGVLTQGTRQAELGVDSHVLLELSELRGAPPKPENATGLFHFAVLLPTRADLGRTLRHLMESGTPVQGASDHLVSEAIYLSDLDGNGIEIYRDRPRSEWPRQGDKVRMATDPLDAGGILAEADHEGRRFTGLPLGTTIGHIHLQVGDIAAANEFYVGQLGFDVMASLPSALFVSAGGYHHHVGANTWTSRGQGPASGTAGLIYFGLVIPGSEGMEKVIGRLRDAGLTIGGTAQAAEVADPWSNRIRLETGESG